MVRHAATLRRREAIGVIAGALTMPFGAQAQQASDSARRLGVLTVTSADDPIAQRRGNILKETLAAADWKEGGNLRLDWRDGGGDRARIARFAEELVALQPDVILAVGTPCVDELRQRTSTIPIVFAIVTDPVGQGIVASLSQPGGNVTGFTDYDGPMAGKWLEMLTQITPRVTRVSVLYNPASAPFAPLMLRAIENAAASLSVKVRAAPVDDGAGVTTTIAALAHEKNTGLLVLPDFFTLANRALIVASAARAAVPAAYWSRIFVDDGGLMSYSTDTADLLRRAASYIDRILKGASPSELPVQNPAKFDLTINLKAAAALGVTVSSSLLATADEVIE
ncbi:MAG TPA: ABC transporter substrate-binding protein [Bradyrhizobium sp.]|jgi:putative ABC transport system substrate-binding protein